MALINLSLEAPLDAAWSEQYVKLGLPGVDPGAPLRLELDGRLHHAEVIADVERPGGLNAGKYPHGLAHIHTWRGGLRGKTRASVRAAVRASF